MPAVARIAELMSMSNVPGEYGCDSIDLGVHLDLGNLDACCCRRSALNCWR
jgi:hypothetical protein